MNRRRLVLLTPAILLAAALAACSSTSHQAVPSADGQPATPSATGTQAAAGPTASVTATPQPTAPVAGSTRPLNPPPSNSPNCLSGTLQTTYPSGDNPLRSACVHVGTRIQITLNAATGYPWRAVTSTDPHALVVTANTVTAGSVQATAQSLSPGTAVLSSTTRPTADPSGPMTKRWQLTITVVP